MSTKRHIRKMLILFCVLFALLAVYLISAISAYGTRWFVNPYNSRIQAQKGSVYAGRIMDRNGIVLAQTDDDGNRVYASDRSVRRATSHVVGDNYGQTFGAETFYANYLLGFDQNVFERLAQAFSGEQRYGSSVALTVDAQLCDYAYDVMDDYRGAIVVMNYKTGEILASVSQPTFDPKEMKSYLDGDTDFADSAMVNRVTMGRYTPGSTFKIVTLIAALRYIPDIQTRTFECGGPLVFDSKTGEYLPDVKITAQEDQAAREAAANATPTPETTPTASPEGDMTDVGATPGIVEKYSVVRDYQSEYHGELTLLEAFEKSCNTTFARVAMEVGASRLKRVARELGVGEEFLFEDMVTYASYFEEADTDLDLAWSGVGQYKDLLTPLNLCMITSAIANDGVMMEPKLLRMVISTGNLATKTLAVKQHSNPLKAYEAQIVQDYMVGVVKKGTGTKAGISGYTVGGKTGTAEISGDKSVKTHAWFTGFVLDDDHPLAITVVLEKAGSGGNVAAPIAGKILKRALKLGY
ncbi:MAG: penicillin-binding transpeptidase domain-containing protein [Bacillota bacterium]